jgi:hypothetical protein
MAAWFPRLTMWFQVGRQGSSPAAAEGGKSVTGHGCLAAPLTKLPPALCFCPMAASPVLTFSITLYPAVLPLSGSNNNGAALTILGRNDYCMQHMLWFACVSACVQWCSAHHERFEMEGVTYVVGDVMRWCWSGVTCEIGSV